MINNKRIIMLPLNANTKMKIRADGEFREKVSTGYSIIFCSIIMIEILKHIKTKDTDKVTTV